MRTITKSARAKTSRPKTTRVPLLQNGDVLSQPEFHRRYEAYPDERRFELIGGIVYLASPLRADHSDFDGELGFAFGLYRRSTVGVKVLHNASTILGPHSEPQPDLGLRLLPEYGGQSQRNRKGYIEGPPELLAEIAFSTVAIDLHQKRLDYQRAGVIEYLVICVEERELHWFHLKSRRMLSPDSQGILRSRVFPGLWIDSRALLACDSERVEQVVREGLASPEHAAFTERLRSVRSNR